MKAVALWFFITAVMAVTRGMIWGIQMSASGSHLPAGAHAQFNLVGWATMALFGIHCHLTPAAAGTTLAKVGLVLTLALMAIFRVTVLRQVRRGAWRRQRKTATRRRVAVACGAIAPAQAISNANGWTCWNMPVALSLARTASGTGAST